MATRKQTHSRITGGFMNIEYTEKEITELHGLIENIVEEKDFWDDEEKAFFETLYEKLNNHLTILKEKENQQSVLII